VLPRKIFTKGSTLANYNLIQFVNLEENLPNAKSVSFKAHVMPFSDFDEEVLFIFLWCPFLFEYLEQLEVMIAYK
jgi:hypothetical protein